MFPSIHGMFFLVEENHGKHLVPQTLPGADLIVATVGRLYDFVRAGIINLEDESRADLCWLRFQKHQKKTRCVDEMPQKISRSW